ncbi:MAG: hypothetical protein HYX92_02900 [Chloroflexi bacterium]|nr:hypothetical protein [Chloroflexota bacterium]
MSRRSFSCFGTQIGGQAANIAFDREAAIAAAMQGRGVIGGLLYPGGEWARPRAELDKKPGYRKPGDAERAEARKLLAEAGFADGFKSTITTRQGFVESVRPEISSQALQKLQLATASCGTRR